MLQRTGAFLPLSVSHSGEFRFPASFEYPPSTHGIGSGARTEGGFDRGLTRQRTIDRGAAGMTA